LFLGGAAVHRCDNCIVLNAALAAEGAPSAREILFPQPAGSARRNTYMGRVLADFFGAIGANVGCELLVALHLEVAQHFIERFAASRIQSNQTRENALAQSISSSGS
jgi:hypothetical protein